jgi:hypothetical protein
MNSKDVVNVVVTLKPQRVYAAINGALHVGKWKTGNPGENCVTRLEDTSNERLLNAAMCKWSGETHFTTTIQDLYDHSGGYGL